MQLYSCIRTCVSRRLAAAPFVFQTGSPVLQFFFAACTAVLMEPSASDHQPTITMNLNGALAGAPFRLHNSQSVT